MTEGTMTEGTMTEGTMTDATGSASTSEPPAPPAPDFPPANSGNRAVWLSGLLLFVVVVALLIAFVGALRHWFALHTGTIHGGPDVYYNFWSGFGSDLGEATLISAVCVGVYTGVRKVNCHTKGCWRIGHHALEGTPYILCKHHHPTCPTVGQRTRPSSPSTTTTSSRRPLGGTPDCHRVLPCRAIARDRRPQRRNVMATPTDAQERDVAALMVRCLEAEGVTHIFGIPGEENIHFVRALDNSTITYVLTRHEQAASFMAETYGRITGRAGVCSATLGPGAINLLLGTADATTNSAPLVALSAQVARSRSFKESHQNIDLVPMFAPATKWAALVPTADAVPEMMRKAFKLAQTERPGAVYLAIPEDVEKEPVPAGAAPLRVNVPRPEEPSPAQLARAVELIGEASRPIVLAGHGAARAGAAEAVRRFVETLELPVATTFHGKGVVPDDHPNALGSVGFMRHDYVNFGFDAADLIIAVGYELQEFDPVKINPQGDKKILHVHRFPAEVDAHYDVAVGLTGDIARSLDALGALVDRRFGGVGSDERICGLLSDELARGRADQRFPLAPARIVAETRAALRRDDIVLVDTGALKMWMARLYPTYEPNTCLISNGLSTMAWSVPGALGAKIARPEARVLAATGDGSFLMNSQEIETALRLGIPYVILVWVDDEYGLIKWKMELELGAATHTGFRNPDFVAYADSFGAKGYRIGAADELGPVLARALADDTVSVVACPVDYSDNLGLTEALGQLDEPIG
jgi:acetolactate synthase I/II/III large subunit